MDAITSVLGFSSRQIYLYRSCQTPLEIKRNIVENHESIVLMYIFILWVDATICLKNILYYTCSLNTFGRVIGDIKLFKIVFRRKL